MGFRALRVIMGATYRIVHGCHMGATYTLPHLLIIMGATFTITQLHGCHTSWLRRCSPRCLNPNSLQTRCEVVISGNHANVFRLPDVDMCRPQRKRPFELKGDNAS